MAPSGSLLLALLLDPSLVLEHHAIRTGRVWTAVYKTPLSCLKVGQTPDTTPVLGLCVGLSSGYTPLEVSFLLSFCLISVLLSYSFIDLV